MKANLIRAQYHLAADWHGGQWSREYRLLCRVAAYARKHGIDIHRRTHASQRLYQRLVARYGAKL